MLANSESLPSKFSKWLPSCKMAAKVWAHWTGSKWWPTSRGCWSHFLIATVSATTSYCVHPPPSPSSHPENPEDATLGINSLARVFTVSSRDSSRHRALLVSFAWQKTIQGYWVRRKHHYKVIWLCSVSELICTK